MNVNCLLPIFPLLPVAGIILISIANYIFHIEAARFIVPVFVVIQMAAGILIIVTAPYSRFVLQVSSLDASIVLSFSRERIWILAALLAPLLFSVFKIGGFGKEALRTVFLFYLAACSGILVTGDVFNFFVFYELMIMAAYVLISVEGKVYASIKYMFVGALSSVFFLTGIIFVYASGLSFRFEVIADLTRIPESNALLTLSFFFTAFCIKSAMFPASPWLPTCHSAGNGTVSSFLSSFTVVSGFFGLYYLVLLPARSAGIDSIFSLLKIIGLITMAASSVFIFFDTDIKRVIAGSTAFIAGFIGYLFAIGKTDTAWVYIFVHAVYKSLLFHTSDDLYKQPLFLRGRSVSFITIGGALLFAGGIFPSIPHFIKRNLDFQTTATYIVFYVSATLLLAGFLKFTFSRVKNGGPYGVRPTVPVYILAVILIPALYLLLLYPGYLRIFYDLPPSSGFFAVPLKTLLLEGAVIAGAVLLGKVVFPRISGLSNFDSRYIFRTLSIELFALLLLFAAVFVFINVPALHSVFL